MSMLSSIVSQQRRMILLMEAIGLLHDVGKLGDGFLKRESQEYRRGYTYDFGAIVDPNHVFTHSIDLLPIQWLLKRSKYDAPFKLISSSGSNVLIKTLIRWNSDEYSLAEILLTQAHQYNNNPKRQLEQEWYKATNKSSLPSKMVRDIHGFSHYEKEDPDDTNRQLYKETYRSTPFGFETRICVESAHSLSEALKNLPLECVTDILTCDRQKWLAEMRFLMSLGIADTRRPDNEVTLWDWGYTVASFIKAALSFVLVRGLPANLNDLTWRVLSLNLDMLNFYTRVSTITDLLGIQTTINEAFAKVKHLLEEAYPMANEIYRDETGIYFIFPDLDLERDLEEMLQACFPPDLRPLIKQSPARDVQAGRLDPKKNPTGLLQEVRKLIAEPRKEAIKKLSYPTTAKNFYDWQGEWTSSVAKGKAEICTVCGMRPVAYSEPGLEYWATPKKAKERNICCICLNRRGRRSQDWAKKVIDRAAGVRAEDTGTIWTDEISDINGRLALIVGSFDLDRWLDGTFVQTILVTTDPSSSDPHKQFVTKNPSPARLRRIWETTRQFWQDLLPTDEQVDISKSEVGRLIGSSSPRLEIQGILNPQTSDLSLGDYHTYELDLGPTKLSVVWIPGSKEKLETGKFITADNLEYVTKQLLEEDIATWLEGNTVNIEESSGYGSERKLWGTITIANDGVRLLSRYTSAIPLLAEPQTFMALVPADKALEVIDAIRQKYEHEMGKVRNRLSLHLGVVYAERRTPLRAILEAGRKMLTISPHADLRIVKGVKIDTSKSAYERDKRGATGNPVKLPSTVTVTLNDDISWEAETVMGDKNAPEPTFDSWYPYVFVETNGDDNLVTERQRKFKAMWPKSDNTEESCWLVHVAELKVDDKIYFTPSTFDFEWLDVAGRRFEIYYDKNGKRFGRPSRPYLLDQIADLRCLWEKILGHEDLGLTNTQINVLMEIIEKRRQEWYVDATENETFNRLVCDTLREVWGKEGWKNLASERGKERIKLLKQAAISGMLADVVELYMKIMKQDSNKK